jgi:hypothetical protein
MIGVTNSASVLIGIFVKGWKEFVVGNRYNRKSLLGEFSLE